MKILLQKMKRVWFALSSRLLLLKSHRKHGAGLLKLEGDVQTCGYEDVQVMWEMLQRTENQVIDSNNNQVIDSNNNNNQVNNHNKRKQLPLWRIFVWSSNRTETASSQSPNHSLN